MTTRTTTPLIIFVSIAALVVTIGATQTRDSGAQSAPVATPAGTGVLTGLLVTDTATPRPVRRAAVRLTGAPLTSARITGTDDEGRFAFAGLPAGAFSLSATKTGYVQAFHGSKRPGRGPGVPVAVADGQRVAVTLRMLPGAVITGTVTDSRGNPAPAIPVLAVEIRPPGSTPPAPLRATTDDRGVYRIFGLAPGDYLVSAIPPRLNTGRSGGATLDLVGVTDAEVQWARRAATAGSPGSITGPGASMPPPGRPVAYAPVFYPGTTDANAAAKMSVAAGEERTDIGFSLRIVPTARIAGTLVDENGQAVTSATVSLDWRRTGQPSVGDSLVSAGGLTMPRAVVSAPVFSIAGVTPGEYTLVARTGSGGRGAAAAPAGPPPLWNVTDVTVDGQDQTNLVLRLQPGMTVSGSIAFERSTLARPDDASRIDLVMNEVGSLVGAPAAPRAMVNQAGAFRFASVFPGSYALRVTAPVAPSGARWTLKSVMVGARDVADVPLEVKPGEDVSGMVITFTDRESAISGKLLDTGGRPITRYSIIVFTVERSLWLPNARRIRSVTPATDGSFSITGLPAGDYAIAAAEDVEPADLADPAFLSQALASAYRVTLTEGERKTQDLRVGG